MHKYFFIPVAVVFLALTGCGQSISQTPPGVNDIYDPSPNSNLATNQPAVPQPTTNTNVPAAPTNSGNANIEPSSPTTNIAPANTNSVQTGQDLENHLGVFPYDGERSDLGDGKTYYSFKSCDSSVSKCTYYLLDASREKDFSMVKSLQNGMQVWLDGQTESKGAAAGGEFLVLTDDVVLAVIVTYEGDGQQVSPTYEGTYYFKACSEGTSNCRDYYVAKEEAEKINPAFPDDVMPRATPQALAGDLSTNGLHVTNVSKLFYPGF